MIKQPAVMPGAVLTTKPPGQLGGFSFGPRRFTPAGYPMFPPQSTNPPTNRPAKRGERPRVSLATLPAKHQLNAYALPTRQLSEGEMGKMKDVQDEGVRIMLRVPSDVKAWLETEAVKNWTSQNAQAIRAIRSMMESSDKYRSIDARSTGAAG